MEDVVEFEVSVKKIWILEGEELDDEDLLKVEDLVVIDGDFIVKIFFVENGD